MSLAVTATIRINVQPAAWFPHALHKRFLMKKRWISPVMQWMSPELVGGSLDLCPSWSVIWQQLFKRHPCSLNEAQTQDPKAVIPGVPESYMQLCRTLNTLWGKPSNPSGSSSMQIRCEIKCQIGQMEGFVMVDYCVLTKTAVTDLNKHPAVCSTGLWTSLPRPLFVYEFTSRGENSKVATPGWRVLQD